MFRTYFIEFILFTTTQFVTHTYLEMWNDINLAWQGIKQVLFSDVPVQKL